LIESNDHKSDNHKTIILHEGDHNPAQYFFFAVDFESQPFFYLWSLFLKIFCKYLSISNLNASINHKHDSKYKQYHVYTFSTSSTLVLVLVSSLGHIQYI